MNAAMERLGPAIWWAMVAVGLVAALLLLVYVLRLVFNGRVRPAAGGRARMPRLGVVDAFDLDRQRQLVLVRRDNVEHLLMIGGPTDVVVESSIVRAGGQAGDSRPGRAGPMLDEAAPEIAAAAPAALATPNPAPEPARLNVAPAAPEPAFRRPPPTWAEPSPPPSETPAEEPAMAPRAPAFRQPPSPPQRAFAPPPQPLETKPAPPPPAPDIAPAVAAPAPSADTASAAADDQPRVAPKPKFDFSKLPRPARERGFAPPPPIAPSSPTVPSPAEQPAPTRPEQTTAGGASRGSIDDGLQELEAEMAKLLGRSTEAK
jgi:hypothetical protein